METNKIVGRCKHCGDPIYRFQAVAHEGCTLEALKANHDVLEGYSDFGAEELWEAFNRKARNRSGYLIYIPDDEGI